MSEIALTYRLNFIDSGLIEEDEDEDYQGGGCYEDNYFIVKDLPPEHVALLLARVKEVPGCSERVVEAEGGRRNDRIRISCDENHWYLAKDKLIDILKSLVPDASVRYRETGHVVGADDEEDDGDFCQECEMFDCDCACDDLYEDDEEE